MLNFAPKAILLALIMGASALFGSSPIHEDFKNLDNWKQLHFPKIPTHTTYTCTTIGETR